MILSSAGSARSIRSVEALRGGSSMLRSEEHTSELQSHHDLVCRLLLEKKNQIVEPRQTPTASAGRGVRMARLHESVLRNLLPPAAFSAASHPPKASPRRKQHFGRASVP